MELTSEDLQQMNRTMRHKLRNHCAGMEMSVTAIREELEDLDPSQLILCDLMLKELKTLESFTDRMNLVYGQLLPGEPENFYEILQEITTELHGRFPQQEFTIQNEASFLAVKAGEYWRIILREMLTNACLHGQGDIDIHWQLGESFKFKVVNNCNDFDTKIPITPPKPFYTNKGRCDGLGLSIVDRLCKEMNGEFEFKLKSKDAKVHSFIALPFEDNFDV